MAAQHNKRGSLVKHQLCPCAAHARRPAMGPNQTQTHSIARPPALPSDSARPGAAPHPPRRAPPFSKPPHPRSGVVWTLNPRHENKCMAHRRQRRPQDLWRHGPWQVVAEKHVRPRAGLADARLALGNTDQGTRRMLSAASRARRRRPAPANC
jgi:hypothetical protein